MEKLVCRIKIIPDCVGVILFERDRPFADKLPIDLREFFDGLSKYPNKIVGFHYEEGANDSTLYIEFDREEEKKI